MSRRSKNHRFTTDLMEQNLVRKYRKNEYGPVYPRPGDLTVDIILERMSQIYVGDRVTFDSFKECLVAEQVDRHNTTISATAPVVEHCGGYVMVKLRNGLMESVNYFDIMAVNGHSFPGYIKRDSLDSKRIEGKLWQQ